MARDPNKPSNQKAAASPRARATTNRNVEPGALIPVGLPVAANPLLADLARLASASPTKAAIQGFTALARQVAENMLGDRMEVADGLVTRLRKTTSRVAADLMPIAVQTLNIDPRLQLALLNRRTGKRNLLLSSTDLDEVAVIAKVKSVEDWSEIPDVFVGAYMGASEDGQHIVTARIPLARVTDIRQNETVLSLKASQLVQPNLASTLTAMNASPQSLPANVQPDGGAGVVIGIVDFGCDFAHRNFLRSNGKTRLLALWDQSAVATPTSPFGYGRRYTPAEINHALSKPNPYAALGYGPDPADARGSHGTHVADIAAGNGLGSGQAGLAPKADIIFVEASSTDIPWAGPATVNKSFGDSVHVLEAVKFIFEQAGDRPCVCNLSLGTNGGAHDGTSLLEQGLDAILREKPNRAIVIAASNSQAHGIHTQGTVTPDGPVDVDFIQQPNGGAEFELWYDGTDHLSVTLVADDGTEFGPVAPGDSFAAGAEGEEAAIFISNRTGDPTNGSNVTGIWVAATPVGAAWRVRLSTLPGAAKDTNYHAWLERNDRAQAKFFSPVATHTLGSISTGMKTIVVGSYDAHKPSFPLSSFSSSGPTRDNRQKPEISAPGQDVVAARSLTRTGVVRKSGTSMAAPAVTGLIALIYAEAMRTGTSLTIDQLRAKLLNSAFVNPPNVTQGTWDPRYGFGRANAQSI